MTALLHLDGYGPYVWAAWGIAAALLVALTASSFRTMRARERELAALEAKTPRRQKR